MRWVALVLVLAGCQATKPELGLPADGALVAFGNGGSINGGGVMYQIAPNNVLMTTTRDPGTHGALGDFEQLPEGAFQAIISVALREIVALEHVQIENNCLDAGTDRIFVREFDNVESLYENNCPDPAADAALNALRSAIATQRTLAEDQGL